MFSRSGPCLALPLALFFMQLDRGSGAAARFTAGRATSATVRLFDTGAPSPAPLPANALTERTGWTRVPKDKVAHTFKGDIVFLNNRLAVALRRKGRGAELYSAGPKGFKARAVLTPVTELRSAGLSSVKVVANRPGGVVVEAGFMTADGRFLGLRYGLKIGQIFVQTEPLGGVKRLRAEAPCRFAVLPDFFADDIVVDATELAVSKADLPSENFLLSMLGNGEAILMSVWNKRREDIRITLSGEDTRRVIDGSEIDYGKDGKIWVAIMAGESIWHARKVAKTDAGRVIRLDWKTPCPAQWRLDWKRADSLTGSWEMIVQRSNGRFMKHGWFGSAVAIPANRRRWTTVLGRFQYPCWINTSGQGYIQPFSKTVRFEGPAIIYPINRVRTTPLGMYTVVDIVRATLGVGPCEYILDVEGQRTSYRGWATCSTRDELNAIYGRGQQRRQRAKIEHVLKEVMIFVRHIRGRIETYVAFGHEMLKYLAEQKKAHPELAQRLSEMETLTKAIDARVADRREEIKTPAYAAGMVEKFRRTLIDYEGRDALSKCKQFTKAMVEIGSNQDELVGECRMAVKVLRQRAGLAMALDPRMAEVAREIRRRTQKVLRNPASHEAPRH